MSGVPPPEGDELGEFSGRKFSQYSLQHRVYCVPVDQTEQQRVDQFEDLLYRLFQDRTVFPDLPALTGQSSSRRRSSSFSVLDCGCGQGRWMERLLEEVGGDCDATGVDIYFGRAVDENDDDDDNEDDDSDSDANGQGEVQEYVKKRWNLNTPFRDDRSDDRLRPESFDLINSRLLADGINANRWPAYIHELKLMLKHGGWLQMVEIEPFIQSSAGRLNDESFLTRWWQWYSRMMPMMGKNPRIGRDLKQHLQRENFTHIHSTSFDVPIGQWCAGQETIGNDNLLHASRMLVSLSLWPFVRLGGMSDKHWRELIVGARAELRDASKRLYYKVHVVYGQRPRPR